MVTLLFTSIAVLIILVVAVYFWQRPAQHSQLEAFDEHPPLPPHADGGLFTDNSDSHFQKELKAAESKTQIELLISRAATGDNSAVDEAHKNFDRKVYDEILNALVKQADSDASLLSVLSHVTRNELPVTSQLAEAAINSWRTSPDRGSTSRTLHITALADDARLYQSVVESALQFWRQGLLLNVSATELRALFDGEFWVLSSQTRNSGAGFILKLFLGKVRRELDAAARVK